MNGELSFIFRNDIQHLWIIGFGLLSYRALDLNEYVSCNIICLEVSKRNVTQEKNYKPELSYVIHRNFHHLYYFINFINIMINAGFVKR